MCEPVAATHNFRVTRELHIRVYACVPACVRVRACMRA